jgi:hypothetical protein
MPDTATLQTWLEQVEDAIQRLTLGEQTTNLGMLQARRAELRKQLGLSTGRRPFGVSF